MNLFCLFPEGMMIRTGLSPGIKDWMDRKMSQ